MILRYVACKILKPSSRPPTFYPLTLVFSPCMKPCSLCVHVCGTKRVYCDSPSSLSRYRPRCIDTVLIVCVHRLELLGGNIWWTRSDCSHTTQVWEDCAVTGMVKVACYVAVQECCSDAHCSGHLCSIFPIGCTPLKHIIHTKPHLQIWGWGYNHT